MFSYGFQKPHGDSNQIFIDGFTTNWPSTAKNCFTNHPWEPGAHEKFYKTMKKQIIQVSGRVVT